MNKARILLLAIFSSLLCSSAALAQFRSQSLPAMEESSTVKALRSGVEYLSSAMLEGRAPGSEGEKLAAEWLSEQFRSAGLDLLTPEEGDVFGLRQPEGDTLVSRNVAAFIPGYDNKLKDSYIVIGARLDNIGSLDYERDSLKGHKVFYGANGNASGLAMLSCLAERLSRNRVLLKRSVLLVGFGASTNMCAGSWYFLNRSFPDAGKIAAMVNLDILGLPSGGFYAYTSSNPDLNDLIGRMSLTLQPLHPSLVSKEIVSSDHRSFYEKEIPSVLFSTGAYREYMTDRDTADILEYDDMERVLEYIYNFTLELVNGSAPEFRRSAPESVSRSATSDVFQYHECDTKPVFMGSSDPANFLRKWVYTYLRYPRAALEAGVQGRVLVSFVIDEKGKVRDVKVEKGVSDELDAEAVRVISASPDWKSAKVGGKKVKCSLSLYVDFKLEKKKR